MAKWIENIGLDYDDVLLVPQYSEVASRSYITLQTKLSAVQKANWRGDREYTYLNLDIPLIAANMDTISGEEMALAMSNAGGAAILHRYQKAEEVIAIIDSLKAKNCHPIIPSIGINNYEQNVEDYLEHGAHAICIDIAHGHHSNMLTTIRNLKNRYPDLHLIAGNICTEDAARDLMSAGASALKVGIGPGSHCLTRMETGHGVPQFSAITDVMNAFKYNNPRIPIIADGGIKTAGDIVKALAAGASSVMIGSAFAGTNEALSQSTYRGMASGEAMQDWKGSVKNIEGRSSNITPKGSVIPIIDHLCDGIRSGLSYSGAISIPELQRNAIFMQVKRIHG